MPNEQPDTIVGAQVELKGSLKNHGPIHIHGHVTGDVTSDSLVVVGETAIVTGPITAKVVDVSGQVHGSITVEEQVELQPHSLVKGDITSSSLSVKPGAVFIGKSQMNIPEDQKATFNIPEEEPKSEELPVSQEMIDKKKPRLEIE